MLKNKRYLETRLLARCFRLFSGDYTINDLIILLVRFHHAEFYSRPLLDRSNPFFQVANLSINGCIALREFDVLVFLLGELFVDFPDAKPAPLAQPKWILDGDDEDDEGVGEESQVGSFRFTLREKRK
jgi:hypothetical protein